MAGLHIDIDWLARKRRVTALIDIGANSGEFATFLSQLFSVSLVHAIEPLPRHAASLKARNFTVHSIALSDREGTQTFHISAADSASSLLPLTPACLSEFPQVAVTDTIVVPVKRLDDVVAPIEGALIKIDAQGAEREIIKGGHETIRAASLVLIEMTYKPLYEGQALFNEIHRLLDDLGFELIAVRSQHMSATTGEPLFAHMIYENRALPA